jgi:hypothetical protein
MNFYTQQHKHYCGIDLHAKAMYVCILDQAGTILVHKNLPTTPEAFLRIIAPYRDDVVVGVECMFTGKLARWRPPPSEHQKRELSYDSARTEQS